jgi:hypothetical protein
MAAKISLKIKTKAQKIDSYCHQISKIRTAVAPRKQQLSHLN